MERQIIPQNVFIFIKRVSPNNLERDTFNNLYFHWLPRPTTSIVWKLLIFVQFDIKHLQMLKFKHSFYPQ